MSIDALPNIASPAATEAIEELRAILEADSVVGVGAWAKRVVRDNSAGDMKLKGTPEIHVAPIREPRAASLSGEEEVAMECVVAGVYQDTRAIIPTGEAGWEVVAQALFSAVHRGSFTKSDKLASGEAVALPGDAYGLSNGTLVVQVPINLHYIINPETGEKV